MGWDDSHLHQFIIRGKYYRLLDPDDMDWELEIKVGDCVRIPDGCVGRVREVTGPQCRVRVRSTTSETHQFLDLLADDLERVDCPKGWMSPEGCV